MEHCGQRPQAHRTATCRHNKRVCFALYDTHFLKRFNAVPIDFFLPFVDKDQPERHAVLFAKSLVFLKVGLIYAGRRIFIEARLGFDINGNSCFLLLDAEDVKTVRSCNWLINHPAFFSR